MAKTKKSADNNTGAASKPIFRDRGLSRTIGLVFTFSVSPALAHEATIAPVIGSPPVTHTAPTTTATHTFVPSVHHQSNASNAASAATNGGNTTGTPPSTTAGATSPTTLGTTPPSTPTLHYNSLTATTPTVHYSGSQNPGSFTSNTGNAGSHQLAGAGGHGAPSSSSIVNGSTSSTTAGSQAATHHHAQTSTATTATATSPQALNLGSSAATFSLGTLGNFKTVTIDVGGTVEKVSSTTKLTASELLAADQALHSPPSTIQGLTINSQGVATSGEFTVTGQTLHLLEQQTGGISALTIPTKVTFDDNAKVFSVAGDLSNFGSIVAQTQTGNTIQANNIINGAGAMISGVGPLTLTAVQSITNAGTIKSASDLNINAASLQNSGPAAMPAIGASHNLNIDAPTITNSGILTAQNNVNFTSSQSINVQQSSNANITAGTNINFRDPSFTGAGDVNVVGGNVFSQQLNVYAPVGNFNLNAGQVTGAINGTLGAIHTETQTGTLNLGNLNITGDPAFYNQGNIAVSGAINVTNGVPLAIVASGNIISNGGSLITSGGDLTLIAGANFSTNDSTVTSGPNWSTVLNVFGASSTGGFIDLTGNNGGTAPVTAISTAVPNGVHGNGGDVAIIAFSGSGAGSGSIALPANVTINTNGADFSSTILSKNGNVDIVSAATSGNGISIGSITANGGTGGGGIITLDSATPTLTGVSGNPYQIINGQPYGTVGMAGLGPGSVTFYNINGFIPFFNTPEIGGSVSAITAGGIYNLGSIYDEGVNLTTSITFEQTTNWTAGSASVTTGGYFGQQPTSSIDIIGVSGHYNINAAQFVDFEGQTSVHSTLQPPTMNVTTGVGYTTYVGYAQGASAAIAADNLNFNSGTVLINGSVTTPTNPDTPPGSGNVSFINTSGNLLVGGNGILNNSGTLSLSASGNATLYYTLNVNNNYATSPNEYNFNAGGLLAIAPHSLTVSPDPMTGTGGTVSLTFGSLSYGSTSGPFIITANGGTSGTARNGGTVSITNNNSLTQIIGTVANDFEVIANAGNLASSTGGSLTSTSGAAIFVDPAGISLTGQGVGGALTFNPATNLAVIGSLNVTPVGGSPTNYGSIRINLPNESIGFLVGATGTPVNGIEGNLTGNVTITSPIGLTVGPTFSIQGNALSLTSSAITNDGLIMGTLVGSAQTSSSVNLVAPTVNNSTGTVGITPFTGEIGAAVGMGGASTISVSSPSSLSITGLGKWDSTFGYSFAAASNLYMGELFNTPQATPTFTQLSMSAGGLLAIGTDSLATSGAAQSKISLSANTVSYANQGSQPFNLTANSSTGSIIVNLTSTGTQTIGIGAGDYSLSANGGMTSGAISFTTAGALVVQNTIGNPLNNPNGNLTLVAGTNLGIVGGINQGTGNVILTTGPGGVNPFIVGITGGAPVNGTGGNISGAMVTINEGIGVTINNNAEVQGASLVFNTPSLTNNGLIDGTLSITIASASNLSILGNGTYDPTGTYTISGATLFLGPLFTTLTSNEFNTLNITASGVLNLGTNTLKSQGGITSPNLINIGAGSIAYNNQSTTPLTLNTSSINGGGSVTFALTGTTPLTVGNGAGQLTVDTSETQTGGTGVGNVSITNGGALTINPNYLLVNTTNDSAASTDMTFVSGGGNLLVSTGTSSTGWSPLLLGPQGTLNVTANTPASNMPNLFYVGSFSGMQSGFNTSVAITGQSISINNNGGGIYLSSADVLSANANGGSVSLGSSGQIYGATGVETISAPTISLISAGSIGLASAPIIVNTPSGATASSITLSSPTAIYMTDNSAGFATMGVNTLTLAATSPIVSFADNNANAPLINIPAGLPNSTTVTISAPGTVSAVGIQTLATIGNQLGVVILNAGTGTITEKPTLGATGYNPLFIEGTTVALTANDVLSTNTVNSALQTIEGAFTYNGSIGSGHQIVNNSFFPTSLNAGNTVNFNYQSNGEVVVVGTQTNSGTYNLVSWGQIFVNAPINGGAVTLQTVSGGPIASLNGSTVSGSSVNLVSDYGNFTTNVNTANLTLSTTGIINLTNTNTGANSLTVSNTPTAVSFLDNGQLTVGSNIITSNGNILLEATNTSSGSITVAANKTILASSTQPTLGQVYFSIGTLPASFVTGTVPANVTIHNTGGGLTFFGSNVNPNQTITANAPNNTLNASGRFITFNSDNRASAITLSGGDTITADPPVIVAPLNALPSSSSLIVPSLLNVSLTPTTAQTFSSGQSLGTSPGSFTSLANFSGPSNNLSPTSVVLGSSNSTNTASGSSSSSVPNSGWTSPSTGSTSDASNVTAVTGAAAAGGIIGTGSVGTSANAGTSGAGTSAGVANLNSANATTAKNLLFGGVAQKHHDNSSSMRKISESKVLESGAMILAPEKLTTVQSRFGTVSVAAKSLVVLVATDEGLSVFNLHDDARDSVVVTTNGKSVDVYPGRHVTVGDSHSKGFEQINPGLFIAHRGMKTHEAGEFKIYTSEFHIPSAIRGILPLKTMLTSSTDPKDQKLASKVFKTVAILQILSGNHGDFALMTPKPLTAYSSN